MAERCAWRGVDISQEEVGRLHGWKVDIKKGCGTSWVEEQLSEYYEEEDILSMQQQKIRSFRQDNEIIIHQQLLAILTRVAYPKKTPTEDEVKWVVATPSVSIISSRGCAERTPRPVQS